MPGVNVTTSVKNGPSTPLRSASGQAFFSGLAERGPSDAAILIRGLADYESVFGKRPAYGYLYDTVKTFFDEGGEQAYVTRVVGPDATKGTIVLVDRATPTPANTLTFDAASAGAWSGDLKIAVEDGSIADSVKVTVLLRGEPVEVQNNLRTPAQIAQRFSTSVFVDVTNMGSTSVGVLALPAVGVYTVTAGDDKRSVVQSENYIASLENFTEGLGDGAVAIPGVGPSVHDGLVAHAKKNRRIALLSHNDGATKTELAQTVTAVDDDSAGLFAPWIQVNDGAGGIRNSPPEGFVAACRARAHDTVGAWRAPAGGIAIARNVLGVATEYTKQETESLDAARVSVIRRVSQSLRLYGWRSLSSDEQNYGFLSARDVLNRLVVESEKRLEDYVFAPIDSKNQLLSAINAELVGIVEPMRQAGGLYEQIDANGQQIDPGYMIETGNTVNSAQSLANNEVRARLSVRLSPTGALVSLDIVKVSLLSGL
ncbi:putative structural protein [Gordonia phage GMA6]|uniref:Putative structural protein n=1 Tax=Gordonia phage GMA6 TaxID=1647285 RepID=A0A0K0NKR3_9CAUD|nr:putative structural protein [Gordonia phage GMA6]AKL88310.1 putative structural protein [Gordonia phage GMA6]